jgi:hypothetical protein
MVGLLLIVGLLAVTADTAQAGPPEGATIRDGTILTSAGVPVVLGVDEWGYNYQAHRFNGGYCDSYRDAAWCQPYAEVQLAMQWNDAWLSNRDRDDDNKLDRYWGFDTYIGSGAWLTNLQSGVYEDDDGNLVSWNYFVKIVAVPADANAVDGVWYTSDGVEIGPQIWGAFAITQQVSNDPGAGEHGSYYLSPNNAGFGAFSPH